VRVPHCVWRILLLAVLVAGPAAIITVHGQQPQKPAEDEFRPISELPPGEALPAAPLLIAAYSVVWLLVAGYLFSIWKRLDRVDRELAEVSRRLPQRKT
jgi:CcmD family protein